TSSRGCRAPATSSWSRFSRTRTWTACSRPCRPSVTVSSPPPRATTGRCRRPAWRNGPAPTSARFRPSRTRSRRSPRPGPWASRSSSRAPCTSWQTSPRMRAYDGERWRQADRFCVRGVRSGGDRRARVSRRVLDRKNPPVIASTFSGIHDFFSSGTWQVIRNLLLFFLIVFWLAVGYWVYKDAKRRIEDPVLIAMAVILGLIPPYPGALGYMLFRPPEYLE